MLKITIMTSATERVELVSDPDATYRKNTDPDQCGEDPIFFHRIWLIRKTGSDPNPEEKNMLIPSRISNENVS